MGHLPDARSRALYYWYYATQVMHNIPGPDWDKWNRQMRRVLIDSQVKEGCAAGSWDPMRPTRDPLGERGGRVLVTGLSTLTLEVYYRYLPLYKLDAESKNPEAVKAVQGDPKAAAKWSSEGEKTVKEDAKDAGKGKKDDAKNPAPKKDDSKSWFGSWFKPDEPKPSKTVKDFMDQPRSDI